jgi:hypothetical protein
MQLKRGQTPIVHSHHKHLSHIHPLRTPTFGNQPNEFSSGYSSVICDPKIYIYYFIIIGNKISEIYLQKKTRWNCYILDDCVYMWENFV